MKEFVLDCSVAMAWCFEEEACDYGYSVLERARNCRVVVPSLWHLELVNVVSQAEYRKRITPLRTGQFFDLINSLTIEAEPSIHSFAFTTVLAICRAYNLTAYDACYLELCLRKKLPLATLDKALKRAAVANRIELVK